MLLALELSAGAFDRRLRNGKLDPDCATLGGERDLYRREDVRALLLGEPHG